MLNVLFMGTPSFAAHCLERIIELPKIKISGVVSALDKKAGRGQKIKASPVKTLAKKYHLKVIDTADLSDSKFLDTIKKMHLDIIIVVAFRKIPEKLWAIPSLGAINLHASYLPHYRGAAPIHWVLINGEKNTGLSLLHINNKIDMGDIIIRKKINISPQETYDTLHEKLMKQGAQWLSDNLMDIEELLKKKIKQQTLQQPQLKIAPKINKSMAAIDWNQAYSQIEQHIRAMNSYPGAHTYFQGVLHKVYAIEKIKVDVHLEVGEWKIIKGKYFCVACKNAVVSILTIQKEGKKRMPISEYLKGVK